jgi:dienelactone hydrolase
LGDEPVWVRRFTAPKLAFPRWSSARPDRLVAASTEGGTWQAWAFDASTGERRGVTEEPVGVEGEQVLVAPDGRIVWWHDETGDERGCWLARPFEGGEEGVLVPNLPEGWAMGISFAGPAIAQGIATEEDYRIYVSSDGRAARELYRHESAASVGSPDLAGAGGLSADGRFVCVSHSEHGDILHPRLRVLDTEAGRTVGELWDEGRRLGAMAWSPVPGDTRLALVHERGDVERPAIWDPVAGTRVDLRVDLPGGVYPAAWWPDGSALLVRHEHEGLDELHRLDPVSGALTLIAAPHGEIPEAAVRPDGDVWLLTSNSLRPPKVIDAEGRVVLAPAGDQAPAGHPFRSFWFDNPHGQRIQAFVVTPPGTGPFPIVMSVHGGPEWHQRDAYDAESLALVDEGYAVALVNYRGSTGYGIPFRETLTRNIGFPESEDVVACLDALVDDGVADPDHAYFVGWSWGGYLACLNAGINPGRWRALVAGIPTGDYVAAHWASSPPLRAWDVAIMGGHPDEAPELYRERDPMTYVDNVRAPVLIIAGEHDSRCPLVSATNWRDAVLARGGTVELCTYASGHHANASAEQVRHMRLILEFLARHR